jgi:hypothetical protein
VHGAVERPTDRVGLGAPARHLFADAAAAFLDLVTVVLRLAIRGLRELELGFHASELVDHISDLRLETVELGGDGVHAGRPGRFAGERLARLGFAFDGAPVRLLGVLAVQRRRPEPLFGLGELAGGDGSGVGGGEHVRVEHVEPLTGRSAFLQTLVPSVPTAISLAEQGAQTRCGERARERIGLLRELLVPLGRLRLLLQRLELSAELGQDVAQPQQVLIEASELALGPFLAATVLRDAGSLFDVLPTLLGTGEEHLFELTLSDDGVQGAPDPRLRQQLLDVEQPDGLAADPVLRLAASEDGPADLDLRHRHGDLASAVVDHELDLGHAERRPRRGAREDHIGHVAASERPRSLFAEHPADRVDQVRFARSVGPHDDRDAREELQDRLVRERLEPTDRDRAEEHRADANRHVILRRGSPHLSLSPLVRACLARDGEAPEPLRCLDMDLEGIDPRAGRSVPAPGRHRLHRTKVTLEQRLHAPVGGVADPSTDISKGCFACTRCPEEHALDATPDDHATSGLNRSHHRTVASGQAAS